jgi:hypothetical protein
MASAIARRATGPTDGRGCGATRYRFTTNPAQRYKIEIVRFDWRVAISVDSVVLAKGNVVPFTDLARNLTVGCREGPSRLPLTGAVSDLKIARLRPQE